MTVRSPEGTHEVPVPTEKRRQAALRPLQAAELARLGGRIAQLYGQPMDIEWAIADERLFILQARPITALPEPPAVLDWTLPRPGGRYARGSVIELLPDPLSPLFETLGLPLWNAAMGRLAQAIGFQAVLSEQMLTTINDYAYYDWAMSGSQAIRVIGAFVTGLPRFYRLLGSAQTRWTDGARPEYEQVVRSWSERDLGTAPARELLEGAQAIVKAAADHYLTVQSGILPVAYMSEAAFTSLYRRLAQRANDPPALTFMLGFDSEPIRAEKSLYDLAAWARSQPALADYLSRTGGTEIVAVFRSPAAPIADAAGWQEFARRFARHLDRFGHAVYDLDFAKNVPADDPAPLLETLKYFLGGSARSPYERQQTAAADREQATEALLRRLRGLRLRLFRPLLGTAQRYAPLREDALADAGLGWPQLRRMLHEVGRRLVEVGAMADEDDVFWFEWDELQALGVALDAGQPMPDSRDLIAERRAIWARERVVTPPVTLPLDGGARWLGIDWSRFMPARSDQAPGDTITGIGASPGRIEGTARVIHGPEAFGQMRPGDILVAKITTPAWTPLFALAAGIVTDVGGPLSHSSIVAREYHIPAVLGTGVATARIRSGQRITVDGDRGAVTVGVQ
jgi:pyruvate,water dikinase